MTKKKPTMQQYHQLHPFCKYLRLLKQLPEHDYMQAKRAAETGVPRCSIGDLLAKRGVYLIINADQQQVNALTKQIVNCRRWDTVCRMENYDDSSPWQQYTEICEAQERAFWTLAKHWDQPMESHQRLVFISHDCDLRGKEAVKMLRNTLCTCRHWGLTLVWFYNPYNNRNGPAALNDRLQFLRPELRIQIDAILDCQYHDLIKVTSYRHKVDGRQCITVLPKHLAPVEPTSMANVQEAIETMLDRC